MGQGLKQLINEIYRLGMHIQRVCVRARARVCICDRARRVRKSCTCVRACVA